jgi:hypothetical protein
LEQLQEHQWRIAEALGDSTAPARRLVWDLVARLPGVIVKHAWRGVTDADQWELTKPFKLLPTSR